MVRAGGAFAVAVDAFKTCDGIPYTHALQEGGDSLGVAMATTGEEDLLDGVTDEDDVNLARAHAHGNSRHEPFPVEEVVVNDFGFHD